MRVLKLELGAMLVRIMAMVTVMEMDHLIVQSHIAQIFCCCPIKYHNTSGGHYNYKAVRL